MTQPHLTTEDMFEKAREAFFGTRNSSINRDDHAAEVVESNDNVSPESGKISSSD